MSEHRDLSAIRADLKAAKSRVAELRHELDDTLSAVAIPVTRLRFGDCFEWCGRAVQFRAAEFSDHIHRWVFVVEADGTQHRLGYRHDESVMPAPCFAELERA